MPASPITQTTNYRVAQWIMFTAFKLLTKVETVGIDTLPIDGPYMVAVNHLSAIDTPLTYVALGKKRDSTGVIADSHRKNWFFRYIVDSVGGIWISRGESDRTALKASLNILKSGRILGLAPEGTRSKTYALQEAKTGVAFLAKHSKVPVYPFGLWNTQNAFPQLKQLRRPHLRVLVGEPLSFNDERFNGSADHLQAFTDELMCRIAALLPPQARGFYADWERTRELLVGQA